MKKKPIPTERICQKREAMFLNADRLSGQELELLSKKWHKMINRYTVFTCKAKLKKYNISN
ncbi:MAG: hypothetical protein GY928_20680 [Colwellia sp.]|nr:hypothetical protein [Colwellia sp.]